jgi:hypothetical protein
VANVRRKSGKFFSISRALGQDETLSAEAVGVMAYLLSKPDDWEAQLTDIERRFKIGREKRQRIVRELEDAGYMERIETRENGKFDYTIIVHETPLPSHKRTKETTRATTEKPQNQEENEPSADEPSTANPSTVKPSTVNPSTYIYTDKQETDIQKTLSEDKGSDSLHAKKESAKTSHKDVRANHAAITAVRKFLPDNKYPNKLTWDGIIESLGENPDIGKLEYCAKAWATISKNMYNLTWVLEWYQNGVPDRVKANLKPPPQANNSSFGVIPGTNVYYRRRATEVNQ